MSTVVANSGAEVSCVAEAAAAAESVVSTIKADENSGPLPEGPVIAADAAATERKAPPIPAAEARKRRKAIITSQRQGVGAIGEDGVSTDAAVDLLLEQGAAVGLERGDYVDEDAAPLADEATVAAAAAVASNNAADEEEAAAKEASATAKPALLKLRKRKTSVDEEEDRSDDDASQSDGSKANNGNSKKTQIRYDPSVPMDKEQLAAWRREARRVRNRESAAASRQRIRGRISELEVEVNDWKTKYETAVGRLQRLEDAKQIDETANPK